VSATNAGDHRTEALADERATVAVPAVRIDDVVPGRVDLIKLDTQGSEHVALEGASRLVTDSRPRMLVEFWPKGIADLGDDPLDVLRRYRSLGYRVRVLEVPELGQDAEDATIVTTIAARPDPVGGFATLVLEPHYPAAP
jgi:Methyltransferase FkbM domain